MATWMTVEEVAEDFQKIFNHVDVTTTHQLRVTSRTDRYMLTLK